VEIDASHRRARASPGRTPCRIIKRKKMRRTGSINLGQDELLLLLPKPADLVVVLLDRGGDGHQD